MASIRKEVTIEAPADAVWNAVRDIGQVHKRLVPGVLTDAPLLAGTRRRTRWPRRSAPWLSKAPG